MVSSKWLEDRWDSVESCVNKHRRKTVTLGFFVFFLPQWGPPARDMVLWLVSFMPSQLGYPGAVTLVMPEFSFSWWNYVTAPLGVLLMLFVLWETRRKDGGGWDKPGSSSGLPRGPLAPSYLERLTDEDGDASGQSEVRGNDEIEFLGVEELQNEIFQTRTGEIRGTAHVAIIRNASGVRARASGFIDYGHGTIVPTGTWAQESHHDVSIHSGKVKRLVLAVSKWDSSVSTLSDMREHSRQYSIEQSEQALVARELPVGKYQTKVTISFNGRTYSREYVITHRPADGPLKVRQI